MFFWTRSKEAPLALSKLLCESSDLLGSFETLFLVVLVRAVDVVEHEHIYIYIHIQVALGNCSRDVCPSLSL